MDVACGDDMAALSAGIALNRSIGLAVAFSSAAALINWLFASLSTLGIR